MGSEEAGRWLAGTGPPIGSAATPAAVWIWTLTTSSDHRLGPNVEGHLRGPCVSLSSPSC
jgi:hypothetical protein